MKRELGPVGVLFAAISGVVGSGWLFGPYYAAQIAGPSAIFSWIIGGILMMIIAMTFAELATMLPIAGGVARFSHFTHGSLVSFTMSWCAWLSSVVVAPIETMALIQYTSSYIPFLTEKIGNVHELTYLGIGVASVLMLIMCIINYFGIRWVSKTNNFIVFIKLIVPILTLIILLSIDFSADHFTSHGFAPYGWKGILTALPSAGVIFSFIGYNPAIQLAGETKNPQKMIPFAIIGTLFVAIVLYFLIQLAFIGAISPEANQTWKDLHFSKDSGPFVGLAAALGLGWLIFILYFDAVVSPFGTALIYTSSAARINYAMSQNGYMPASMQKLNHNHVPFRAIMLNFIIGMILFLPFPGWQNMVEFLVSAFIVSYAVGPVALICLRDQLPKQKRPFKVPFPSLFSFTAFYICNLLVFWTGWNVMWRILTAIAIGYIALFFYRKKKTIDLYFPNAFWLIPYLIGLGILSFIGSFGEGLNIMTFGWDFLVLLIFSFGVFLIARKTALSDKHVKEMLSQIIDLSHEESTSVTPNGISKK